MKQNTLITIILGIFLPVITVGMGACSFLDIVPDEQEKAEDAFADKNSARNYLYSCYSFLPNPRSGTASLDLFTGDEVTTPYEHETFSAFPKGNYTASNPVISYWNTIFSGLRQCYMFLDGVEKVPDLSEEVKTDYKAQVDFLIAYYHFLLARCYGPILLIKETPYILTSPENYLARTPYDECVEWICTKFDEAAKNLPATRETTEWGLATSVAAKALKAKLLLYAASPLFNGNSEFYANFVNKDGTHLMPQTYDAGKWAKARDAYKEAISWAEKNGYALYTRTDAEININKEPTNPVQRCLRYTIMDYTNGANPEVIWAETRDETSYDLQNKSIPFVEGGGAWNGVAPTMAMLKRFYTKRGLPVEEDPDFVSPDEYFSVVTVDNAHADEAAVGVKTFSFNLDREPRYYAWVAFQGGFFETLSATSNGGYNNDPNYKKYSGTGYGKLACSFVLGGNCSRGSVSKPRPSSYSPTGFLNKKGVSPTRAKTNKQQGPTQYPWPIIRLTELYLGYAEACVETNDLDEAKSYLNKVRIRAGIPTVEESWRSIGVTLTQEKLREIVRQERMIEFYLENQNFWDMRRWLLAEKYFGVKATGMDIMASTLEKFCRETTVDFERKFESPTQYLMPIPIGDINKNEKLVNNPGY